MMQPRRSSGAAAVLAALLSLAAATHAQAQIPDTGLIAVGGDLGVLFPAEEFENTLAWDAFGEYFVTPRIGVRAMFAYASPGFQNRTEDHFRQSKLLFNGLYYWTYEKLRPFATAGAGFYFVREKIAGQTDPDGETRGGLNFGGGVEYVIGDGATIKGEARWDRVSHPPGLSDASGFTLTVGYKRYF